MTYRIEPEDRIWVLYQTKGKVRKRLGTFDTITGAAIALLAREGARDLEGMLKALALAADALPEPSGE